MKIRTFLVGIIISTMCGCASMRYAKMYEGEERPDTELAGAAGHSINAAGEQWVVLFVGVDGVLCPADPLMAENGPLPRHNCANLVKVRPGRHTLSYVVQSTNKIAFLGPVLTNSWIRSKQFESEPLEMRAGTLYIGIPEIKSTGEWALRFMEVCKTSNLWEARASLFHRANVSDARCP